MEMEAMEENKQVEQHHVDTSRPFTSVKEAVATFGQQIMLPGKVHTVNSKKVSPIASPSINQTARPVSPSISQIAKPVCPSISQIAKPLSLITSPSISQIAKPVSPFASPSISQTTKPVSPIAASPRVNHTASFSSSPRNQRPSLPCFPQGSKEEFVDVLKKLEAELTETKTEVRMMKERESDTKVALASLNAELHKNIAKMAKAVADAAGKNAAAINKALDVKEKKEDVKEKKEKVNGEEERRKELMRKMAKEYTTLVQILDSNKNGYFAKITKKKKKPIVPPLGDFFFFNKKGSSTEIAGPLYTTSST